MSFKLNYHPIIQCSYEKYESYNLVDYTINNEEVDATALKETFLVGTYKNMIS